MQKRDKVLYLKTADNISEQPVVFFRPQPLKQMHNHAWSRGLWKSNVKTTERVAARDAADHALPLQLEHGSMQSRAQINADTDPRGKSLGRASRNEAAAQHK